MKYWLVKTEAPAMSDFPPPMDGLPLARPVFVPVHEYAGPVPAAVRVQMMPMPMRPLRAIIELLMLIPAGVLGWTGAYFVVRNLHVADPRWYTIASSIGMGSAILAAIALMLKIAGHRALTIGWTAHRLVANIAIGAGTFVYTYLLAIGAAFLLFLLHPDLFAETPVAQRAIEESFPPPSLTWMVPLMLFVAIWEEVAFRGFMLTRLHALVKSWWVAVPLGAAIFGGLHLYEGVLAVVMVGGMGLIMGVLFVWRKSLMPGIMYHLMNNLVMLQVLRTISTDWS